MKQHYQKTSRQLAHAQHELELIEAERDLARLHRFVVELKTSLPERLSYENSPLLLAGLRISQIDQLDPYLEQLKTRLSDLRDEYRRRAAE